MSALPVERLRDPEQIYTPEFPAEIVDDIVESLTEEGGRAFFRQVTEAMQRVQTEGDLRPLNEVYEAWYRTLIFISDPDADKKWDDAQTDDSPGLSTDQLREKRLAGRASAQP